MEPQCCRCPAPACPDRSRALKTACNTVINTSLKSFRKPEWSAKYCGLLLLSCLAMLSSCASQQTAHINDWEHRRAQLEQLDVWQIQGKLGVRTPGDSSSVSLSWKQSPDNYAIHLSGPFGQGATSIKGNRDSVQLLPPKGEPLVAATPEELLIQALGWDIPLQGLYYWIRGIPAPREPVTRQNNSTEGTLTFLEQSGWQLTYSRYQLVDGWQLPEKIIATRGDIRLVLVIKRWHF